uniref:Uncharacterized protein n=1 Tax=Solanum tuberosum TaxID=4113 RepID=M1D0Z5_SOLTU
MVSILSSFPCLILILILSFSMLIQPGLLWHAPSGDLSEFYAMPQCWMAMEETMVCGYKVSAILGGNLGDGSMDLVAIGNKCCKAINDASSKCTFEGVNPLNAFIPQFVKDMCVGINKENLFKLNYPFAYDQFRHPLKNSLLKNNHVLHRKLTLPIRSRTIYT